MPFYGRQRPREATVGETSDNPLLIIAGAAILFLATIVFPALLGLMFYRRAKSYRRYGSLSGVLMGARVSQVFGQVSGVASPLLKAGFRVVGLETDEPALGLEYRASGPGYARIQPVRLSVQEARQLAGWLQNAAENEKACDPGGGWTVYKHTVFGAAVRALHGSLETNRGKTRLKLHVTGLAREDAPVGIGIRRTLTPLSDQVVGAGLTRENAMALAKCLSDAAACAESPADTSRNAGTFDDRRLP